MKKVIAWLLVLALTAAVSIGATLAYLTDTDEDVNVMTLGKVKIDQLEYERIDTETKDEEAEVQEFHDNKPLYPGVYENGFDFDTGDNYVNWDQIGKDNYTSGIWNPDEINNEVDKMVFVKNKGDYDAYVRSVFAFEAGKYTTLEEFKKMVHLNLNETDYTWEWVQTPVTIGESTYFVATATYNKVLTPGALTEISLSQIALDKTATNEDVEAFGETYQVLVKSQAVQADGFDNAADALEEGFGVITTTNIPWDSDAPTKGIDVRTALHYLEGDTTTSAITANVSSVTFGLNKAYTEITDANTGVLVDVEQDVPVYAYYVKNGSNYDVYFLADDDIYLPKDSSTLMMDMTALTAVNTDNLNTSRTENMQKLFRKCAKLATLDTTDWDTSKVTDMSQVFYQCSALKTIPGIEDWETGSVTTMKGMFRECSSLTTADIGNWNTSKVTDTVQAFYKCNSLTELDLSGWNLPVLTDASNMFRQCANLKNLDLSGWNTPALTNASLMFYTDPALETVDITGWNTPAVQDLSYLFAQCSSLKEVIGSGDLDTDSAQNLAYLFYGCGKLTAIDGTENWKVNNATTTNSMFRLCTTLVDLDTSTWHLENVTDTRSMFSDCASLKELDATNYGMPKNVDVGYMFGRCYELVTVKSTNWSLANVDIMHCMFYQCKKLKNVDTSSWQTGNVTDMQSAFNGCLELEYVDVSNWDVRNVKYFNSMFTGIDSNAQDMHLKEIDISKWQPLSAVNMNHMFYGCAQLTSIDMSGWNLPNLYTTSHMFADCAGLETIDISGWKTTSKWYSMDAMFNDCRKVKSLDVSSFDTSGVVEFSQIFESCWALEEIKGLENWNTANGKSFDETFLSCGSLKELNLSGWDTRNAMYGNKHLNGDTSHGFDSTFSGVNSLTKLTLGENFDFDGNGTVTSVATLPNPAAIDGQAASWYNAANDTYYAASEIPDGTAATYVAAVKPADNTEG